MKFTKLLCVSTLAFTLVGCSSNDTTDTTEATAEATEEAKEVVTEGNYEVTNNTGATVTELYFYDANGSDKGTNMISEDLADGESVSINVTVDEEEADGYSMKVEYVTDSGDDVVVFETLSLEDTPFYLKSAADIESGATPFSQPE